MSRLNAALLICASLVFAAPASAQQTTSDTAAAPPTAAAPSTTTTVVTASAPEVAAPAVPYMEQSVCRDEPPLTGGLLQPRTVCKTRREWQADDKRTELGRELNHFVHENSFNASAF